MIFEKDRLEEGKRRYSLKNASTFKEEEHPRAEDGKFGTGGGDEKKKEHEEKKDESGETEKGPKTGSQIKKEVQSALEEFGDEYSFLGIRFEQKKYDEGEEVLPSKSNWEREDERDFPDYGTKEYEELPELSGSSAYALSIDGYEQKKWINGFGGLKDDKKYSYSGYIYIIGSNDIAGQEAEDPNELVMKKAKVLKILQSNPVKENSIRTRIRVYRAPR